MNEFDRTAKDVASQWSRLTRILEQSHAAEHRDGAGRGPVIVFSCAACNYVMRITNPLPEWECPQCGELALTQGDA